jgi:hypothetical protein
MYEEDQRDKLRSIIPVSDMIASDHLMTGHRPDALPESRRHNSLLGIPSAATMLSDHNTAIDISERHSHVSCAPVLHHASWRRQA